jgi:hypothetical protein
MGGMIALHLSLMLQRRLLSLSLAVTHCGLSTPTVRKRTIEISFVIFSSLFLTLLFCQLRGLRGMLLSAASNGDIERQVPLIVDLVFGRKYLEKPIASSSWTNRDAMIEVREKFV